MARWRPEVLLSLLFTALLFSACVTTGVSPQDKKKRPPPLTWEKPTWAVEITRQPWENCSKRKN